VNPGARTKRRLLYNEHVIIKTYFTTTRLSLAKVKKMAIIIRMI